MDVERVAGGKGAECGGEVGRDGVDVMEGDDPVSKSDGEELAVMLGEAVERSGGRIDEGTERAGERGFSASGGTFNNKDGIGADGPERGGEPDEAAGLAAGIG